MSLKVFETLDAKLNNRSTKIANDLKLNYKRIFEDGKLTQQEAILSTIALAKSVQFTELLQAAKLDAQSLGITEEIITEAEETAAIMGMLNIYYRYRHFVEHNDPSAKDAYGAAKLRMTALAAPAMGKVSFELLALAVSAINGCERCISAHEQTLLQHQVSRENLHDVARLAAIVKGLSML